MGLGRGQYCINQLPTEDRHKKILDIGFLGGNEREEAFIHKKIIKNIGQEHQVYGLDININREKYIDNDLIKYIDCSIFDLGHDLDGKFDVVYFCEVFEHLQHPYLSLHKIAKSLKNGGKLVMTYPNPLSLKPFIRYLFTNDILNHNFITKFFGDPEHKVLPLPTCMVRYLSELNFEVEDVSFLKGRFSSLPILKKFSSYIGIVAVKKDLEKQ